MSSGDESICKELFLEARQTMRFGGAGLFRSFLMALWAIGFAVTLSACGTIISRQPLPENLEQPAQIPGMSNVRFWGDAVPEAFIAHFESVTVEEIRERQPGIVGVEHHYLAISGGGLNGAFGAGLLKGWTAAGTRPEFTMVTGVSTGALIAPFAFLGSEFDPVLEEIYTGYSTLDLIEPRGWIMVATGDAKAGTVQLREKIYNYMTPEVISKIAEAFHDGRRLFISTTNLDVARPVVWNVTAMAASDHPDKRNLISDVLLASASIPGVFPPVLFDVEWNGEIYDELHVDGGAVSQVFVYPQTVDWPSLMEVLQVKGRPQVYVLRNARLDTRWSPVEPDIFSIVGASVASLIRTQGFGDIDRIYLTSLRDGNDFHLAHMPETFERFPEEPFDVEYMRELFGIGYEMARDGYPWLNHPVGFDIEKLNFKE